LVLALLLLVFSSGRRLLLVALEPSHGESWTGGDARVSWRAPPAPFMGAFFIVGAQVSDAVIFFLLPAIGVLDRRRRRREMQSWWAVEGRATTPLWW